jgi:glutamate-ammonia-ligase adenylyltransferase
VASTAHIPFRDAAVAERNLESVRARLADSAYAALPNLLADLPDPDGALNLLERLCETAAEPVLRLFTKNQVLLHYAIALFSHSQYLGETLIQNPDLLQALAREKNLDRSLAREDYSEHYARFSSRSLESDVALLLGRFKKREYIRIVLRDVLGIATLAETTSEVSTLSDVLIEEALRHVESELHKRYGSPQRLDTHGRAVEVPFTVLSLGKLGGNEVNYSSDVDLLYLFGDGEPAEVREISNREYFIRLAQQVTEILSKVTAEGQVFRIDLRLRPQGREGEPAVALGHAQRYYAERAHDWELQALIKVRHSAGDVALAREFIKGVQPRVYTDKVNFAAIETALNTRDKITTRRTRAVAFGQESGAIDVKLDRGGIRDIEFLVQCLQRIYGGKERWLRSGGTLFSLQKLHDKQHLSSKDYHELTLAYEFLRKVEHRLQWRRGQQVHRLPDGEAELHAVARSVLGDDRREDEGFREVVERRMAAVAAIYERIIHSQQQHKEKDREADFKLAASLESSGDQSYQQLLERLASDSPALYEIAARRELPTHTKRNLHRFLSAAFTSSERYRTVLRQPQAVERAMRLFGTSDFLTDLLIRHPEEIEMLGRLRGELPPSEEKLFAATTPSTTEDPVFDYVAKAELQHGEKLALLRQHYRHRVFAAAATDVMELRPVYDSLAETSHIANSAIQAAAGIAAAPEGFAVVALGRLGSEEFDIASDADVLFVRDESLEEKAATKCAELIVEALAAYTQEGTVFSVDPRLRPRGAEGELVTTPKLLAQYFSTEAHPWEALTYTKLRPVAGNHELGERAIAAVQGAMGRFRQNDALADEVRAMRLKLEKSDTRENFKVCEGGFYDIDFIASYLLVCHGIEGTAGNIRERLYGLAERKLLSDADCATLDLAAELLRTVEHVIRLVMGRARKTLPVVEHSREVTERLTARILDRKFLEGLQAELSNSATVVRAVYERVVR